MIPSETDKMKWSGAPVRGSISQRADEVTVSSFNQSIGREVFKRGRRSLRVAREKGHQLTLLGTWQKEIKEESESGPMAGPWD